MQTFLPHADFKQTARDLDYKRLGKQRVEAWQILDAIKRKKGGQTKGAWLNHPCITIWYNHEIALIEYGIVICKEWIERGYNDTMLPRFQEKLEQYQDLGLANNKPSIVGNDKFHVSHQSNLIRKLPTFYQPLYPNVSNDIPYFWSNETAKG
jgi:hypothetical protein